MSILNRIMVLTLFYQTGIFLYFILTVIKWYSNSKIIHFMRGCTYYLCSVMISYSIFLMQTHNTKEYTHFLKILYKSKLYYIGCCCCGNMIRNDLYSSHSMNSVSQETEVEKKDARSRGDTGYETTDISVVDPKIELPPALSVTLD